MSEFPPSVPASGARADAAIPEAWSDLVARRAGGLHELLAAAVVARTGFAPDPDRVAEYLEGLAFPAHLETERTSETHPGIRGPSIFPSRKTERGDVDG
jgi:hypothetical protein